MSEDPDAQTLQALENEAEKRRKDAARKAKKPLPKCIVEIDRTEVTYTIDPDLLPYGQVDPQQLLALLKERFGLSIRMPSYDARTLSQLNFDPTEMTEERILGLTLSVLKSTPAMAAFHDGRYPTGPNSFVAINSLVYTSENILVNVAGVTDVAEAVVADAFELLWHASGASKKWDDSDIQNALQMKSYGTCTKVDLGCDPRDILNPRVVQFLDNNIGSGKQFGPTMMSFSGYNGFKPSTDTISVWTFDELYVQVHIFNKKTGLQETARIHIDITTKDERGRGIIELTTELPFDVHAELAEDLVAAVAANEG